MRIGKLNRSTNETKVDVEINLDGAGVADVDSGGRFKSGGTICFYRKHSTTANYHHAQTR